MEISSVDITKENVNLLEKFFNDNVLGKSSFRYYKTRSFDVIQNHIKTKLYILDGEIVGYGHLDMDNYIWLGIMVSDGYVSRGIGNQIMEDLIRGIYEDIHLTVDKDNKSAINLYKKKGFVVVDEMDTSYLMKKKKLKMENFKIGIVIQGRLFDGSAGDFAVNEIIRTYEKIKEDCVISTWVDEDQNLLNKLIQNDFRLIRSEKPKLTGMINANLQILSTQKGIEFLESEGYTHILKTRTDLLPNDVDLFLDVLSNTSTENLVHMCWINEPHGYVADFFSFGPISKMKKFWSNLQTEEEIHIIIEQFLCYKDTGLMNPVYNDIKDIYKFCLLEMSKRNLKLIWTKPTMSSGGTVEERLGMCQVEKYINMPIIFKNYQN